MKSKGKTQYRIGLGASTILLFAATIADLVTLIPIAGDIIGPLFWIITSIYFWKAGLGFLNGKRLALSTASMIVELVPGFQALPAILAGITAILIMTRAEDKTGVSIGSVTKIGKKKPGVTPPRNQKVPLNSEPRRREPSKRVIGGEIT
jgi:hypothetical protein